MKKKNWYAVRKGRAPGLYTTWADCQKQVIGFPGAEFKGFYTKPEAEEYLKGNEETEPAPAGFTVYTDGSYNPAFPDRYSYGVVIVRKGEVTGLFDCVIDEESAEMRNVAGEIMGAIRGMDAALDAGVSEMDLYYDYAGIEKWCTGEWKTNKKGTQALKEYYDSVKGQLRVHFHKVASHTGVKYNEMADRLAKKALEVK